MPLAIFAVANIVSLYDPLNATRATWYVLVTLYLCLSWLFFVSFLWTYGTVGMRTIVKTYSFAAMICIVPGLLSYFNVIGLQHYLLLYGRPKGTFKDPNVYGPYLIPVALFAIGGLIYTRKNKKTALMQAAIALISATGIFLSYSRACWINFVVSLVGYLLMAFLFRPVGSPAPFLISRIVLLFAGLTICMAGLLQVPEVQEMIAHRVTSSGLQGYDRDRFRTQRMAWTSCSAAARDRPRAGGADISLRDAQQLHASAQRERSGGRGRICRVYYRFVNPGAGDGMENSRSILAEDFFYCLSLHTRTHY